MKRPLRLRRGVLHQATIFPMFVFDGKVEYLLIVDHVGGDLYLVEWRSGLFSRSWWNFNRLLMFPEELDRFRVNELPSLSRLWHFDPHWLLSEELFANRSTTPELKETNCVPLAPELAEVYFTSDLGAVVNVLSRRQEQSYLEGLASVGLPNHRESRFAGRSLKCRRGELRLKSFFN